MARQPKSPSTRTAASSRSKGPRPSFLDLPGEVLSHVASYLTLEEAVAFLSLHPILLNLCRTHLSPLPSMIRHIVYTRASKEYPPILARLPHMELYLPDDGGRMFLDVLVVARPTYILEDLELGRWPQALWKEAFERRFLPSWRRYKVDTDGDTWRAAFLRILHRLRHRSTGCTHEESWTRFITLHRNGSASINRIYSRSFDPYQIFDELKQQNNFRSEPTTVRTVLHLQDVRIIALGVLYAHPSLFVNQNAHNLLHPPRLHGYEREIDAIDYSGGSGGTRSSKSRGKRQQSPDGRPITINFDDSRRRLDRHRLSEPVISTAYGSTSHAGPSTAIAGINPSTNSNEAYYPLVRSITPSRPESTTYGLGEGAILGSHAPPISSRRSTFSSLFPTRSRRGSQVTSASPAAGVEAGTMSRLGARLTLTRSRDSDEPRARKWSFGRRGSGGSGSDKGGPTIPAAALFGEGSGSTSSIPGLLAGLDGQQTAGGPGVGTGGRVIPAAALFTDYASTSAPGPSILATAASTTMVRVGSNVPPIAGAEVARPSSAARAHGLDDDISPPPTATVAFPPTPPRTPVPPTRKRQLPYAPLTKPQPIPAFRLYPNFTPKPPLPTLLSGSASAGAPAASGEASGQATSSPATPYVPGNWIGAPPPDPETMLLYDRRQIHEEVEDEYTGNLLMSRKGSGSGSASGQMGGLNQHGGGEWGDEEMRVEWSEEEGKRKRWVGPMILICQLFPNSINRAQPPSVTPGVPTEGPDPDLGPKGMYLSLGFDDLEAIMGWVELKGGGAYVSEPRRGGMGFEPVAA